MATGTSHQIGTRLVESCRSCRLWNKKEVSACPACPVSDIRGTAQRLDAIPLTKQSGLPIPSTEICLIWLDRDLSMVVQYLSNIGIHFKSFSWIFRVCVSQKNLHRKVLEPFTVSGVSDSILAKLLCLCVYAGIRVDTLCLPTKNRRLFWTTGIVAMPFFSDFHHYHRRCLKFEFGWHLLPLFPCCPDKRTSSALLMARCIEIQIKIN